MDNMFCKKDVVCWGKNIYIYILLIPTIPISWIKTYTYLSYLSIPAIVAGLLGTIMFIIYCIINIAEGTDAPGNPKFFDITEMFANLGIAIFIYQRNAVILNLRS